jgi:hypothetical protein
LSEKLLAEKKVFIKAGVIFKAITNDGEGEILINMKLLLVQGLL